jgi:hypothetical protein
VHGDGEVRQAASLHCVGADDARVRQRKASPEPHDYSHVFYQWYGGLTAFINMLSKQHCSLTLSLGGYQKLPKLFLHFFLFRRM